MDDQYGYRKIDPYQRGKLSVDGGHTLYWEQRGNANGVPVVLLHGGPGSKSNPLFPRLFNPDLYRIVSFDQRGCGRSRPLGSVDNNDLTRLVEDIETLRRHLGIERWMVSGGSWGSTLGLAYGARYPRSCLGFLLRAIFLCGRDEIRWWLYGMRAVFPEHWEKFAGLVPLEERQDLVAAYGRLLQAPDTAPAAAAAWRTYDRSCSTFLPGSGAEPGDSESTLAAARIHNHYFANHFFTHSNALLEGVEQIRHLPCRIVHGRYDMVCPAANAFDLAARWGRQSAELEIVTEAGHSLGEPKMFAAALAAADRMIALIDV